MLGWEGLGARSIHGGSASRTAGACWALTTTPTVASTPAAATRRRARRTSAPSRSSTAAVVRQLLVAELGERGAPARLVARVALGDELAAALGQRGQTTRRSRSRAGAADEAGGLEAPRASPSRRRREVGGIASSLEDSSVCSRSPNSRPYCASLSSPGRCVSRPRSRRTAAIAPLNERPSVTRRVGASPALMRRPRSRSGVATVRRAHAAIASASGIRRRRRRRAWRRARPARRAQMMHGMIASAVRPADPQNAVPYAAAAPAGVWTPISARWSTTASTAVPIEPPTRWSTFSCGVASGSSERSSDGERGRHRRHEREADAHAAQQHRDRQVARSRCARRSARTGSS